MRGRSAEKKPRRRRCKCSQWDFEMVCLCFFVWFFFCMQLLPQGLLFQTLSTTTRMQSSRVQNQARTPEPSHPTEFCRRPRRRLLVSEGDKHSNTSSGEPRLRRGHCALPHFTWWLVLQSAPLSSPLHRLLNCFPCLAVGWLQTLQSHLPEHCYASVAGNWTSNKNLHVVLLYTKHTTTNNIIFGVFTQSGNCHESPFYS